MLAGGGGPTDESISREVQIKGGGGASEKCSQSKVASYYYIEQN